MNLLLRPHENVNDPVWSVIIMVMLSVAIAMVVVVYILRQAFSELEHGSNDTPKQEELLQLQSSGDQPSPGRGHDRCDDRSGVRSLQEGESESSGSGHSGETN